MDNAVNYADILTKVIKKESAIQPRLKTLKIAPVCDRESGNFLMIMTGWEKEEWINTILFHARLFKGKIVIEDDNLEQGLTASLIQAGIPAEDIIDGLSLE